MVRAVDQGALDKATDGASDGSGVMDQCTSEGAMDGASYGLGSNMRSNEWCKRWIIELCIIYTLKQYSSQLFKKLSHDSIYRNFTFRISTY
jgi:hypothetical protein